VRPARAKHVDTYMLVVCEWYPPVAEPLELTRIGYDRGSESVFGGTPKK
jgi:hypothetical protein